MVNKLLEKPITGVKMKRFLALAVMATACGSTVSAPPEAPVAPIQASEANFVLYWPGAEVFGTSAQWFITTDPDGIEHYCLALYDYAEGSGGVGLAVDCHEKPK